MLTSPLSLYIDTEPDRSAELEIVSRASLAFAAGLRELAQSIDPSLEFRIELLRADEGSNFLKTKLRWIRGLGWPHWTFAGIAIAAGHFFLEHSAEYSFEKALDHVFEHHREAAADHPEQRERTLEQAQKASQSDAAKRQFQDVYRQLDQDAVVKGVGLTPSYDRKPVIMVPRGSFVTIGGQTIQVVTPGQRERRDTTGDFIITRAVLKAGKGRWGILGPDGEMSVSIDDQVFNTLILKRGAPVPLAAGIHITADLETEYELQPTGVWKPLSGRIKKVHDIRFAPEQLSLSVPEQNKADRDYKH